AVMTGFGFLEVIMVDWKHRTLNIEHRTPNGQKPGSDRLVRCSAFDVRCSMFSSSSKNPVLLKRLRAAHSSFNLLADKFFTARLGQRAFDDFSFDLLWHDDNAVEVAEDQFTRPHLGLADFNGAAVIHDLHAHGGVL